MKRFLSILLSLLMITGMFGAASAEGKATLTVMMSSGDFGPDSIKVALGKAADIMGVQLTFDVYPDDQFLNVVNTKLATGNAGDLIVHNFGLTDVSAADLAPLEGEFLEKQDGVSGRGDCNLPSPGLVTSA